MRDDQADRARPATSRLTLDATIQDQAEQVLAEVGQTWQPKGATAIVMDPRQRRDPRAGQLAAGRTPTTPGDAPDYARQDRAVGATYEPGSTFKAFTVAGALRGRQGHAGHAVQPAADDPGRRPRDRRVEPRGYVTLTDAARSSSSPPTSARS